MKENQDDLFNYVLFLRITPFLPNWFINLTGPLVGVPLSPFFWGSVIGEFCAFDFRTLHEIFLRIFGDFEIRF